MLLLLLSPLGIAHHPDMPAFGGADLMPLRPARVPFFDLPQDAEDYVHRIGRTARAGKQGRAYTLACDEYCRSLPEVEALLGEPLPYEVPYDEDYGQDKTPDFTIRLSGTGIGWIENP